MPAPVQAPAPVPVPEIKTENKACYSIEEMVDFLNKGTDISDKKVCMYNLNFEFGKSTLEKSSYEYLDKVVVLMQKNPTVKVIINGHTDNVGTEDANMKLSKERAVSVYDYLVSKGIESPRLTYKSYGSTMPIASNDTEAGRAQNRRVEFEIIK